MKKQRNVKAIIELSTLETKLNTALITHMIDLITEIGKESMKDIDTMIEEIRGIIASAIVIIIKVGLIKSLTKIIVKEISKVLKR